MDKGGDTRNPGNWKGGVLMDTRSAVEILAGYMFTLLICYGSSHSPSTLTNVRWDRSEERKW